MRNIIKKSFTFVATLLCLNTIYSEPLAHDDPCIRSAQSEQQYCPPVETLVSEENTVWQGPDGWTSSTPSFNEKLDEFIGAQWVGINVGEIICIYTKRDRNTFPVTLQRHILVPNPGTTEAWGPDLRGHKDCDSHDVTKCPFVVKAATPAKNVYDEIDFFKTRSAKG